ncbi:MAG: hypothetical protein ACTHOA_05610 [Rhodanobacter sp.]|jgi:hypothetical protein|uniref:Lipoprotein n=2 Tax=unclassified Rhodanobacter TaxID=2621553 RepID=A0AB74ULD5_9GAMM
MFQANRPRLAGALLILVAMLGTGCSGVATREIESARAEVHREPLGMNAKGHPDASIDASGAVKIGNDPLALSAAQKAEALRYREAVIALVDLSLDKAAHMTRHVMARTVFAMMTGRLDKMENKLEQQGLALSHSPEFCAALADVVQRQDRMVQAVVNLRPYAHISQQEVDNCVAGRPYHAGI